MPPCCAIVNAGTVMLKCDCCTESGAGPKNKAGLSRPFSYTYMRFRNFLENAKSRPCPARPLFIQCLMGEKGRVDFQVRQDDFGQDFGRGIKYWPSPVVANAAGCFQNKEFLYLGVNDLTARK
jgi:hypothetical protein